MKGRTLHLTSNTPTQNARKIIEIQCRVDDSWEPAMLEKHWKSTWRHLDTQADGGHQKFESANGRDAIRISHPRRPIKQYAKDAKFGLKNALWTAHTCPRGPRPLTNWEQFYAEGSQGYPISAVSPSRGMYYF